MINVLAGIFIGMLALNSVYCATMIGKTGEAILGLIVALIIVAAIIWKSV